MNQSIMKSQQTLPEFDAELLWLSAILLGFGLVMVYSASIAIADANPHSMLHYTYFMAHQAFYIVLGAVAGGACFLYCPMERWQRWAPRLFMAGMVLLGIVLIPHIGKNVNGSKRWLSLLVFNLQPSEFMKLFTAMFAAQYTITAWGVLNDMRDLRWLKGAVPLLCIMGLVGVLLLAEPDFGALMVIISIAMAILFVGGVSYRLYGMLLGGVTFLVPLLVYLKPYRWARVKSSLDPWSDPFGAGYQLSHSLMAFGRGGWFGVGLGGSVEKLFYLPEAHTDFLLAVIGEELGIVGVLTVIALFAWLVMRAFKIAKQAVLLERHFGGLVAYGIGTWLGVQAMINIGVNVGLFPTKGLTLPLLSYGGSGIVANCIALGILLRVDYENRMQQKGYKI